MDLDELTPKEIEIRRAREAGPFPNRWNVARGIYVIDKLYLREYTDEVFRFVNQDKPKTPLTIKQWEQCLATIYGGETSYGEKYGGSCSDRETCRVSMTGLCLPKSRMLKANLSAEDRDSFIKLYKILSTSIGELINDKFKYNQNISDDDITLIDNLYKKIPAEDSTSDSTHYGGNNDTIHSASYRLGGGKTRKRKGRSSTKKHKKNKKYKKRASTKKHKKYKKRKSTRKR
jgi:hypothetical protein